MSATCLNSGHTSSVENGVGLTDEAQLRSQILAQYRGMLQDAAERGIGTGVERAVRTKSLGTEETVAATTSQPASSFGNVANAEQAAAGRAQSNQTKRVKAFMKRGLAWFTIGTEVSDAHLIQAGAYSLVFARGRVCLAQVLDIYKKSGGKAGKHGWAEKASSITEVSNIFVQIFEPLAPSGRLARRFRLVPQQLGPTSSAVSHFTLLPSHAFLEYSSSCSAILLSLLMGSTIC